MILISQCCQRLVINQASLVVCGIASMLVGESLSVSDEICPYFGHAELVEVEAGVELSRSKHIGPMAVEFKVGENRGAFLFIQMLHHVKGPNLIAEYATDI